MALERVDGLLPFAAIHIFPTEVMAVAVVVGVLRDGELQQREILPA